MRVEELRIGNILQDIFEDDYVMIKSINYCHDDKEYFFYYENLLHHKKTIDKGTGITDLNVNKAIKLTEEWLLKFGFETSEDPESVFYTNDDIFTVSRKKGRDWFYFETTDFIFQIKHVHQLQNLYWSLTGKELKL